MSERRLMADPASARERELLRSWEGERAPAEVRERAVRRAAALAGAATLSAVGASGLTKVAGAAGKGSAWALVSLLKGLAVVVLAGAATYGALHARGTLAPATNEAPVAPAVVARSSSPLVTAAARPSAEPPPRAASASAPAPHAAPVAPALRGSSAPSPAPVRVAPSFASPPEAPPGEPRPPAPRLGDELARIASVRAALAAGDPSLALTRLDELEALYPKSPLRPEAEILRIDALYAKGDREGARTRAHTILARTPPSPYADRAKRFLETTP